MMAACVCVCVFAEGCPFPPSHLHLCVCVFIEADVREVSPLRGLTEPLWRRGRAGLKPISDATPAAAGTPWPVTARRITPPHYLSQPCHTPLCVCRSNVKMIHVICFKCFKLLFGESLQCLLRSLVACGPKCSFRCKENRKHQLCVGQ